MCKAIFLELSLLFFPFSEHCNSLLLMGQSFDKSLKKLGKKELRVLLVGLDGAGKTSILYRMNIGTMVHTIPTVGFNTEEVKIKNVTFSVWDVGGQVKIRTLWRHYFSGTQAIVFVVDGSDPSRFQEAREELWRLLNDSELKGVVLVVLNNKCDVKGAVSQQELVEVLGLDNIRDRKWHIESTCATSGEGLEAAFSWLADELRPENKNDEEKEKKTKKSE